MLKVIGVSWTVTLNIGSKPGFVVQNVCELISHKM